jgi:hypothetical protein
LETWGLIFLGRPNGYEEVFFQYGNFSIKDGLHIRFWKDLWLGNGPLRKKYSALYSIVRRKSDTIALVMATSPPDVTFVHDLIGPRLAIRNALLNIWNLFNFRKIQINFVGTYIPMGHFLYVRYIM